MSDDGDPAAERTPEAERDGPSDGDDPREEASEATDGTGDRTGEADRAPELPVDESVVDRVADHDGDLAAAVADLYDGAERLAERVGELEAELEEREAELDEKSAEIEDLRSRLKRKQADFENYKKRRKREEEKIRERATEDLVERLLDVRDNLRRAVEDDHDDVEGLQEGVKMTLGEFDRVLDAENVEAIEPAVGAEVDPQRHEVMMRVDSDRPEGTIADVYEPGYEMADKVLRPAKVAVSDD